MSAAARPTESMRPAAVVAPVKRNLPGVIGPSTPPVTPRANDATGVKKSQPNSTSAATSPPPASRKPTAVASTSVALASTAAAPPPPPTAPAAKAPTTSDGKLTRGFSKDLSALGLGDIHIPSALLKSRKQLEEEKRIAKKQHDQRVRDAVKGLADTKPILEEHRKFVEKQERIAAYRKKLSKRARDEEHDAAREERDKKKQQEEEHLIAVQAKMSEEAAEREVQLTKHQLEVKRMIREEVDAVAAMTPAMVHVPVHRTMEMERSRAGLPVLKEEQAVMEAILEAKGTAVLICGETGSGKTTQIPQFLWEAGYGQPEGCAVGRGGMIAVTEPRRVAALSMAKRVAEELNEPFGGTVCYHVRYENNLPKVSQLEKGIAFGGGDGTIGGCRLKFMTEGILLKELQGDFLLKKYSAVVVDEAHERSVACDVLIGLLSRVVPLRQNMYDAWVHAKASYQLALVKRKAVELQHQQAVQAHVLHPNASTASLERRLPKLPPLPAAPPEEPEAYPLSFIIMSATMRVEDFRDNPRLFPSSRGGPNGGLSLKKEDDEDDLALFGMKPPGADLLNPANHGSGGAPPVIKVEARRFDVTSHFTRKTPMGDYVQATIGKIRQIHKKLPPGGILVFLPTQRDIERTCYALRKHYQRCRIVYDDSKMSEKDQEREARWQKELDRRAKKEAKGELKEEEEGPLGIQVPRRFQEYHEGERPESSSDEDDDDEDVEEGKKGPKLGQHVSNKRRGASSLHVAEEEPDEYGFKPEQYALTGDEDAPDGEQDENIKLYGKAADSDDDEVPAFRMAAAPKAAAVVAKGSKSKPVAETKKKSVKKSSKKGVSGATTGDVFVAEEDEWGDEKADEDEDDGSEEEDEEEEEEGDPLDEYGPQDPSTVVKPKTKRRREDRAQEDETAEEEQEEEDNARHAETAAAEPDAAEEWAKAFDLDEEDAGEAGQFDTLYILPLFSLLSTEQQQLVFQPPPPGKRLCVVATNIAETSITIPNIRYVVDCGRSKQKQLDPITQATLFSVDFVSQASAEQRAGRAGRVGPGHCYRLYSSAVFTNTMPKHTPPEIECTPLESTVLLMKSLGIEKVGSFPFPSPPPMDGLQASLLHLRALGALESTGVMRCTELGKALIRLPVIPRLARMVWELLLRISRLITPVTTSSSSGGKSSKAATASASVLPSFPMVLPRKYHALVKSLLAAASVATCTFDVFKDLSGEEESRKGDHKMTTAQAVEAKKALVHGGSDFLTYIRVFRVAVEHRLLPLDDSSVEGIGGNVTGEAAGVAGRKRFEMRAAAKELSSLLNMKSLKEAAQLWRQLVGLVILQEDDTKGGRGTTGKDDDAAKGATYFLDDFDSVETGAVGMAAEPSPAPLPSSSASTPSHLVSSKSVALVSLSTALALQPPPTLTPQDEILLRQCILSGLIDQVARKASPLECRLYGGAMTYDAGHKTTKTPYFDDRRKMILWVHPKSSAARLTPPPEYVVYAALEMQIISFAASMSAMAKANDKAEKKKEKFGFDVDAVEDPTGAKSGNKKKNKQQRGLMRGVTVVTRPWLDEAGWVPADPLDASTIVAEGHV